MAHAVARKREGTAFEVEAALSSHPDVLEAAVVGWNDEQKLIKPKAFVVLKSPEKANDALRRALQEHVKVKLAPYKYPRWIEFRKDLPKTATGKIQKTVLRERFKNFVLPAAATMP